MARPWDAVRGQRAVMLTTFRRDGRGVSTPVGYGVEGEELFFMTAPSAGKVKRLSRNPSVEVAASTLRGKVTGSPQPGIAHEVTGPAAQRAEASITSHNRVAWFFLLRKARREGRAWRYYAVRESARPLDKETS